MLVNSFWHWQKSVACCKSQQLSFCYAFSTLMLIADFDSNNVVGFIQPKVGLLETHHSKISLHRAKAGYNYPTIRLPHALSVLARLPTKIYQTVHEGALAFLVVISPLGKAPASLESSVLTWRRSPVRIRSNQLRNQSGFGVTLN
jgi:hypothetical protein